MAAIGIDLGYLAVLHRVAIKAVEYAVLHHRRGNWQIGAGNALGDGDDVRRYPIMLVREHLARPAEAVDDLIDVQKDAVFAAEALDLGKIFVGRYGDADAAHDRLDDHLGYSLGSLAENGGLDGLQAERARIPFANVGLVKLPDGVTDDQAILISDIFPTGYMRFRSKIEGE